MLVRLDNGHRAVSTSGCEDSLGDSLGPAAAGHDRIMPAVCHAVSPQASAVQPDQEGAESAKGGHGPGGSDGEAPWVSAPIVAAGAAQDCAALQSLVAGQLAEQRVREQTGFDKKYQERRFHARQTWFPASAQEVDRCAYP